MPRENGGVVGTYSFTTQNYARGVFSLKTQFNANVGALWPRSGSLYLGIAHSNSPNMSIYPFSSLGFGAKLANPATLPPGVTYSMAFAPDGRSVAVSSLSTPYVATYPFSGSGIGTRYSDPGTLPTGVGNEVIFNPASNTIAVAHTTTPFISVYPWSPGFGSKYSDPATLPASTGRAVTFSPNGNEIAIGHNSTPFLSVYPWSSGFGSKYSNHVSNYTSSVNFVVSIKFHPSGSFITVGFDSSATTSGVRIERTYGFVSGTGFNSTFFDSGGTSLNAATSGGNDAPGVDYHPTGNDIAFGTDASGSPPYIRVFPFSTSTGYGTKYADPTTDATGIINQHGVAFSPDGKYLAVGFNTTPYITAWPWTVGVGFGTKFTNPATLPTGIGYGVAWGIV